MAQNKKSPAPEPEQPRGEDGRFEKADEGKSGGKSGAAAKKPAEGKDAKSGGQKAKR